MEEQVIKKPDFKKEYETVIGLEVHVELATKTKIFCGCSTAFGSKPNTQVCPVCMGMPGTLPVLNRQVVEYALMVGLALHGEINRDCRFDRKNYFYPDNPQNYQISQLYLPICHDGCLTLSEGGKRVRIHEIHMEEDAGKLLHDPNGRESLIDFNRAGVPLLEIVSEPDMENAEEVISYLEMLRTVIRYLGASDCKLQEGSMRADVNLSVREKGCRELGTRTEMKNLNSYHEIRHCVEAERERQIGLLEKGMKVTRETRRWDEDSRQSYSMRSKEEVQDYRYFPDPDLMPLHISEEWLERIRAGLPEMREQKMRRFQTEYGISEYDARMITESLHLATLFERTILCGGAAKKVANWIMGEGFRILKEKGMDPEDVAVSPEHFARLLRLLEEKKITNTIAKEVFEVMMQRDIEPEEYVREKGLLTVRDGDVLERTVLEILLQNQKSVLDYKSGKEKALGFLVGQTMKAMKGQADPSEVTRLLKTKLSEI